MIPHPATCVLLAAPATQKVTHARFLVLIVGIVVVFLGALALLTILRMLRRRTSARLDSAREARAGATVAATSAWHTAGLRATPEPRRTGSKPSDEDDSGDDGDDDDDGSGEFPTLGDDAFDDDDDDDDDAGPPGRFG